MNFRPRVLLSATVGLGLTVFTLASATITGAAAPATVAGFALLATYGIGELAVLSYAPPLRMRRRPVGVAPITRSRLPAIRLARGARNLAALEATRRAA